MSYAACASTRLSLVRRQSRRDVNFGPRRIASGVFDSTIPRQHACASHWMWCSGWALVSLTDLRGLCNVSTV